MEQRKIPPPWIPGCDTRYEHMITGAIFEPGSAYPAGKDPFPAFAYVSNYLEAGEHDSAQGQNVLGGGEDIPGLGDICTLPRN